MQGTLQVISGSDYLQRQEEAKRRWAVHLAFPIQAKANAVRLSEYLHQAMGERVWVEPRVVWVGPGKLHIQGKPAVYVWFLDDMATYADELVRLPARPVGAMQRVRGALLGVVKAENRRQDV